jgi:hypothetical protein
MFTFRSQGLVMGKEQRIDLAIIVFALLILAAIVWRM